MAHPVSQLLDALLLLGAVAVLRARLRRHRLPRLRPAGRQRRCGLLAGRRVPVQDHLALDHRRGDARLGARVAGHSPCGSALDALAASGGALRDCSACRISAALCAPCVLPASELCSASCTAAPAGLSPMGLGASALAGVDASARDACLCASSPSEDVRCLAALPSGPEGLFKPAKHGAA